MSGLSVAVPVHEGIPQSDLAVDLSRDVLRSRVEQLLRDLHNSTGDAAYARAARALYQQSPGRPPVFNDQAAIAEAREMFRKGRVKSLNAAYMEVARATVGRREARAMAERLRRKGKKSSTES